MVQSLSLTTSFANFLKQKRNLHRKKVQIPKRWLGSLTKELGVGKFPLFTLFYRYLSKQRTQWQNECAWSADLAIWDSSVNELRRGRNKTSFYTFLGWYWFDPTGKFNGVCSYGKVWRVSIIVLVIVQPKLIIFKQTARFLFPFHSSILFTKHIPSSVFV